MAIKYVCDACGKEVKQSEVQTSMTGSPLEWAEVTITFPRKPRPPLTFRSTSGEPVSMEHFVPPPEGWKPNMGFVVCSQACAEKVLDEAREQLRKAFEKLDNAQA